MKVLVSPGLSNQGRVACHQQNQYDRDDDDNYCDDDQYSGLPAYFHHDKIPPWWEYVSNEHVLGILLMKMCMIMMQTQALVVFGG